MIQSSLSRSRRESDVGKTNQKQMSDHEQAGKLREKERARGKGGGGHHGGEVGPRGEEVISGGSRADQVADWLSAGR